MVRQAHHERVRRLVGSRFILLILIWLKDGVMVRQAHHERVRRLVGSRFISLILSLSKDGIDGSTSAG